MPLAAIRRRRRRQGSKVRTRVCISGARLEAAVGTVRAGLLGNWRIWRVLVDNKSIAEIGDKCLSLGGRRLFGIAGTTRDSKKRRPITVTGG
jgi:hypothetical protein